jgi:hypothetical protein
MRIARLNSDTHRRRTYVGGCCALVLVLCTGNRAGKDKRLCEDAGRGCMVHR